MNPFKLYRRIERLLWLAGIAWLVRRYWPQIRSAAQQLMGVAPQVDVGQLRERAQHLAADASGKAQAVVEDVKQQVGLAGGEHEGASQTSEAPDATRFATEYGQGAVQSEAIATDTGIPTAPREASFAAGQGEDVGGIGIDREAAERAAGGTLTERPGETGVSRRADEQQAAAYAFAGDLGVPIAESTVEENEPSEADVDEDVVADALQSSVPEPGPEEGEVPDQPQTTDERDDDEGFYTPVAEPDEDEAAEDQRPWEATSASDLDMPAASRGVRFYGEEAETFGDQADVEGLSAETGAGFGRGDEEEEEELLSTGGEIDLENDEAPAVEAADTQDVVSLEEILGEGDDFGGEDTKLAEDTLGLRESEFEPVRAGRNDDVSMDIGTGGPEEEERDSDLGKRPEDVDIEDIDSQDTVGISGDYDKAAETQVIPAVPEDEEAATPPSQGDQREDGSSAQASARSRRAANVPDGAVLALQDGSCPADFPIKGNANSRIYHMPGESSYEATVPEYCFASEEAAQAAGFRPRKR